ncbi:RNA-binding protein Musashi homolog 2-like [Prunus yedoensis var. nudiflora]|uniref:RNA-binding protein Musashi homolog 2-like n=1 Tax=Prunus yedoensis var. nudiflora TaxID=2094558 RepID=A0A314XQ52_PRUYE|nr:RNA-binding protein Musashi homolog 2-like [Prunus yedoensis var. nudiflora]
MDSDQAKLFVGGISRETSEETLKYHFRSYGTVLGSVIAKDRSTNNPRGFGFVWFSDSSSVDKALEDPHVILGRTVDVKKAIPRSEQPRNQHQVDASLTEEGFKDYFEKFGSVTDVVVMYDNTTRRPRGFGFVTFASEDAVENVMQQSFHELNGRFVEVKKAVPKEENNSNDSGYTPVNYPPYTYTPTPTYGILPSPTPYNGFGPFMYGTGVYGGWYPTGGSGGIPYGIAPIAPQAWMFPYPSYMRGGGLVAGGYSGILGHGAVSGVSNQVVFGNGQAPASVKSSRVEAEKLDVDSGSNSASLKKRNSKRS